MSAVTTLRHSGKLLHLGIGRAHSRTEIIALIHNNDATIANQSTGEIHAHFTLDPTAATNEKTDEPPSPGVHPFAMSRTSHWRRRRDLNPAA